MSADIDAPASDPAPAYIVREETPATGASRVITATVVFGDELDRLIAEEPHVRVAVLLPSAEDAAEVSRLLATNMHELRPRHTDAGAVFAFDFPDHPGAPPQGPDPNLRLLWPGGTVLGRRIDRVYGDRVVIEKHRGGPWWRTFIASRLTAHATIITVEKEAADAPSR